MRLFFAILIAFSWIISIPIRALNPIIIKGNAFFDSVTGERFYIRGVDYQPGGSSGLIDPLSNVKACERDFPLMHELGINTIRVYQVDNSKNHDECMKLLDHYGIYIFLDVNTALISLWSLNTKDSYTDEYLQNIFATVDAFKKYTNLIGFFAGNEVVAAEDQNGALPWLKAVIRDLKSYISKQSSRYIYVGYSATDLNNRVPTALYLNCDDDHLRADFYAINSYSWCSPSSFVTSGYSQRVLDFYNFTIPIFLSEFGCNKLVPRPFDEIEALYSPQMLKVFSGGLVYEWLEEVSNPNYGLVLLENNAIIKKQDFYNLMQQYQKIKLPTDNGGYRDIKKSNRCPQGWLPFDVTMNLPKMPHSAEKYIKHGAGKPLGLRPLGTQQAYHKPQPPPDPTDDTSSKSDDNKQNNNNNNNNDDDGGSVKNYFFKRLYIGSILFILLVRIYAF